MTAARHIGHQSEIRTGNEGLGRHFLEKHGQVINLKNKNLFVETDMKHFKLSIGASQTLDRE